MASPDFSQYVDLTIYDIDAFQVYNDAIEYARVAVPEFEPRQGTLEEAIMQAIAYNTSLLSTQINRLPDGLMEGILRLMGFNRREATFATGNATFETFDDNGLTIPLGTVIAYEVIDDDVITSYNFETVADLVIPELSTTGTVAIRALDSGRYPALLDGQELELVSPAPGVLSVQLDGALTVGTNAETDVDYFNRGVRHIASLSNSLTTKQQMANYVRANFPNVGPLAVFDLTNSMVADDLLFSGTQSPGSVTVVAADINGNELSYEEYYDITNSLSNKSIAGLNITAIVPEYVTFGVNVTVSIAQGFAGSEVRQAVDELISNVLSPIGYDFTGKIVRNRLISLVANVPGVDYVSEFMFDISSVPPDTIEEVFGGDLSILKKTIAPIAVVEVSSS